MVRPSVVIADPWTLKAFLVVVLVSIATALGARSLNDIASVYLSVFGTLISLAGFLLAAYIATRQDRQMEELGNKSDEQKEAMDKARKDKEIVDRAKTFFRTEQVGMTPYICVRLEKEVEGENLPFTPTSEDFSLGMLTVMLKERCDRSIQVIGHDFKGVLSRNISQLPERARVFFNYAICASNLLEGKGSSEAVEVLPIWIRQPASTAESAIETAWIWERPLYDGLDPTEFRDGQGRYYGLVARFAQDKRLTFLMSGLSQMGSLVAGNFVEKLLTFSVERAQNALSLSPQEYNTLMGESDFIAVVVGIRSPDSREVASLNCETIWYETGGTWQRPKETV